MHPAESLPQLHRLVGVVDRLRSPGGCPWDREQTELSLAPHLLEEAYEALEALRGEDPQAACEELGDVLMNVLMIARIASESGRYDLEGVAGTIADKLVRRHPHVFGGEAVGSQQVLANWEAIKRREKGGEPQSVLAGVPKDLPALQQALRIGEKAARVGFDWPDRHGPRRKLDEELAELDAALAGGDARAIGRELGDVLFSVVNVARHAGVHPELALRATIDEFARRFAHVERTLGDRLEAASLQEKEALWQQSKRT
jgi:MazG family protein